MHPGEPLQAAPVDMTSAVGSHREGELSNLFRASGQVETPLEAPQGVKIMLALGPLEKLPHGTVPFANLSLEANPSGILGQDLAPAPQLDDSRLGGDPGQCCYVPD